MSYLETQNATALTCCSSSGAFTMPTEPNIIRDNARLHKNGYSIINGAIMYYGGAKTGKTRLLISAFKGSNYIFLDFDRNYKSTIDEIIKSGANYFNGANARNVMLQLMNGEVSNEIVIIDALGAVVKPLCRAFIKEHSTEQEGYTILDWEAEAIKEAMKGIGINGEDTRTFFNHIVEPMSRNGNSINFIHHTTQNASGEKMEGNKGAWTSVFDFTYQMDRETKTFRLEADRLPIAPQTIGFDNVYERINKILRDKAEVHNFEELGMIHLCPYKYITNNTTSRLIMNGLLEDGLVKRIKVGKTYYIDSKSVINEHGQNRVDDQGLLHPLYKKATEPPVERALQEIDGSKNSKSKSVKNRVE